MPTRFFWWSRPLVRYFKSIPAHIWHLVSRKLTWKTHPPMERSIFQNSFFYILRPDSDSSRKSSYTNCPHFFNIPIGSWSNLQKTLKNKGKLNLPSKIEFFAYLTNFLQDYQRKKGSFFTQFFERNPNLSSDLQKNHFEKLTFL